MKEVSEARLQESTWTPGALDGRGSTLIFIPGFPPCGYVTFSNECVYGGRSMLIMFRRLKEH